MENSLKMWQKWGVGKQLGGGYRRVLPGSERPVDLRPMIFSVSFSLLLTGSLIILNSGREPALATDASAVETEAALVEERDPSPGLGRQAVSPSLSVQAPADAAQQANDSQALSEAAVAGVSESAAVEQRETDQFANGDNGSEVSSEGVSQEVEPTVVPTTEASPPNTQTLSATTTQPSPIVVRTTSTTVLSFPLVAPTTSSSATAAPTTVTPTTQATTTSTTTTTVAPSVNGRYSISQVIDGTIGAGDGSNPNEESPMGRHDAPLFLPQGWDWAQGTTRNAQWGTLRSNQYVEFRCAVIPENGHVPPVDFRVNFRNGAYYQYDGSTWSKAFDVLLDSPTNGAYLGTPGAVNNDPFASGRGSINWRQEADGSYSAPWSSNGLMMHFWAGERQGPTSGQIAEFLTSEMRLQQPDGRTVDLSQVRVLFQCGLDYYNTTGGQGTKVPGPGIGKYHLLTTSWQPDLWVTLPGTQPANSVSDFENWLEDNLPPNVGN